MAIIKYPASPTFHQHGAALIVSMVMLLVITIIGVAVMGGSRLELLMSNNSHLQTDALRNAEYALATGLASTLSTSAPAALTPDPRQVGSWSSLSATPANPAWGGTGKYAVEYLGRRVYASDTHALVSLGENTSCSGVTGLVCVDTFRIWALGIDSKGAARILQAVHLVASPEINVFSDDHVAVYDNQVEMP